MTPREHRALELLAILESSALSAVDVLGVTGWTRGQFDTALDTARREVCPTLGVTIPHPVPTDGFRYRVTGAWVHTDGSAAISEGTAYAVGILEGRLNTVLRDVRVAKTNADPTSIDGRKANFLDKHLSHILAVMAEIDGRPAVLAVAS